MRWTIWLILLILCSIYKNLVGEEMTGNLFFGIVLVLVVSWWALMLDYFKRRK